MSHGPPFVQAERLVLSLCQTKYCLPFLSSSFRLAILPRGSWVSRHNDATAARGLVRKVRAKLRTWIQHQHLGHTEKSLPCVHERAPNDFWLFRHHIGRCINEPYLLVLSSPADTIDPEARGTLVFDFYQINTNNMIEPIRPWDSGRSPSLRQFVCFTLLTLEIPPHPITDFGFRTSKPQEPREVHQTRVTCIIMRMLDILELLLGRRIEADVRTNTICLRVVISVRFVIGIHLGIFIVYRLNMARIMDARARETLSRIFLGVPVIIWQFFHFLFDILERKVTIDGRLQRQKLCVSHGFTHWRRSFQCCEYLLSHRSRHSVNRFDFFRILRKIRVVKVVRADDAGLVFSPEHCRIKFLQITC